MPGEHVAEAGDAAVWAASHGRPFERERGPGAVPQQVFQALKVARYVAGWELPADWRLDAAIRYAYSEGEANWFSRWSPSVVLRVPVTERLEVHAEWFGTFTQGLVDDTHRPFFSPGTHFLLADNVEIGLRVGWGLTDEAAPFFSDAGLALHY